MNKRNGSQPRLSANQTARTALVTGASQGLGLALATALAARGWQLIIDARSAAMLAEAERTLAQTTLVRAIPGDINDPAHRQALAQAARDLGGLDAVINNAGLLGPSPQPALLDYPLETLEAVYRTNVIAPLAVLQAVRPGLKERARIINITSDAGVEAYAGWGGYGSSKAAFEHLSHILAVENPAWRVYWVDPGDMRTQMHQDAFPGEDISDRPWPEVSVPGLVALLEGDYASGRYKAREVSTQSTPPLDSVPMNVSELRVVLRVNDLERALGTYRDGLGLPVLERWDSREGSGVLLASGRATIELVDAAQAERIEKLETNRPQPDAVRLAFRVKDMVAVVEGLRASEATVVAEPLVTPWHHLSQRFQLDGQQITVFAPQGLPEAEQEAA